MRGTDAGKSKKSKFLQMMTASIEKRFSFPLFLLKSGCDQTNNGMASVAG